MSNNINIVDGLIEIAGTIKQEPVEADAGSAIMEQGLAFTSMEVLEFVIAIETRYGVKLRSDTLTEEVLATVGTLSDHVAGLLADQD